MKKSYSLIICLLLTICLVLSGCSLFSTDDEKEFKEVDGGLSLYRYEGNSSHDHLDIVEEDGKPIVEIQEYAVSACVYLATIHIGKDVKTVSQRAFCGTNNLSAFTVDEDNPYFCAVDGVLYNKTMTELYVYPNKRKVGEAIATEFIVPDSVTRIDSCAFYMCDQLKKVTLGNSVKEVGECAFLKCSNLEYIELNEGLQIIEKNGFSFCEGLLELHLPSSLTTLGDYAFYSKTSKITSFTTKKQISEISCGKSWRPQTSGLESSALNPQYVGA